MTALKEDIRKTLLRERAKLTKEIKEELDRAINHTLLTLEEFENARVVLLYCPIKGEPNIYPVLQETLRAGKRLILPRVAGNELELIAVRDLSSLRKGSFGVLEPVNGERVSAEELECVIVPGVAFDRRGYRLGFGKGFYDRLLERVGCPKVGIAYSFQVLDHLPEDRWDVPVDVLITEKEVIRRY